VSERPNVVLGTLLAVAATVGGLVAGGLLALGGEGLKTMGATAVGAFSACIFFLFELEQIPFSSLAIVAFAVASVAGLLGTIRAYWRERRVLRVLPLSPIEEGPLREQSAGARIGLFALRSSRPAAFCVGLLTPRLVVSTGLLDRLDAEEQAAVVCHELAHARSREPLKCLLARLAARTFFWLPALSALLDRYLLAKELAADREAIARTSRPALAGALSQVLAEPTPAGAVGLAEFAAARVDRIFKADARLPRLLQPWQLLASALAAGLLVVAVAYPSTLGPEDSQRIWQMLSTMSLHGLPGMLAGVAANVAALAGATVLARRFAR
jgi:Zn-dependent protease with chaperone function